MSMTDPLTDDLPEDFTTMVTGHKAAHGATNRAVNAIKSLVTGSSAYGDTDAVDAVLAAATAGVHTGLKVARSSVAGAIDLSLTNPVVPLAAGAAVPAGLPSGTVILRIG